MGFISRQIEKTYKSVLFRRHDPDCSIYYFGTKDFSELKAREHSFVSKRGHLLYGCFYSYGEISDERIVVLEHGMGNGHSAYFREIEHLCKNGYTVFSYDHTGCDRSEGEHIHGLSGSLSDLDDCINTLTSNCGYREEQISVVGHSWGGYSSLNILSLHKDLRSVVAMSGFRSIKVMQKQAIPGIIGSYRDMMFDLEKRTNGTFAEGSAIDALKETDRPVLIIHSTDDKTVSYKWNFLPLKKALVHKENIEFMTVSGSGHSPHYSKDAFAYKESFFRALKIMRRKGLLKTDDQKRAFASKYDWYRMTEQNTDVWNMIIDFLR